MLTLGECSKVITVTHDVREDRVQIYCDKAGIAELIAKLEWVMTKGGHVHLWDLPTTDPYGQKSITELVIDFGPDDDTGPAARS